VFPIRDDNPVHRPAPVTIVLLIAIVAIYLAQIAIVRSGDLAWTRRMYDAAFIPDAFWQAPLRYASSLVTYAFLHADPIHLTGNAFFLFVFGDNVEARMGSGRFAVFYLAAAAAAAALQGAVEPNGWQPMIGASGAISAVLGVYMLWYPRRPVQALIVPLVGPWLLLRPFGRIPRFFLVWFPAWLYIGYWAVVQFVEAGGSLVATTEGAGVAWWAHVGGFLFGIAAAPLLRPSRRP